MGTASCIALHPARRKSGSWLHLTTLFLLLVLLAWQIPLSAADPLILGVFPRRDAATSAQLFQPLADYLEVSLQRPVTLELSADFDVFISNLRLRRYDLVHLNQFDYVMAHDELKYDALVQNEEFGEKTIKGAVYVRKDSGLTQLDELKGKKILFGGGPRAMMSYVVPTYLLRKAGLEAGDYEEVYAINPPNAVLATYLGRADAGGAGEVVRRLPLVTSKIDVDQLDLIAISDPLPHLPWAVKSEMNPDLKARIQTLLVDLKATEDGARILKKARLTALNPVTDKDYDAHRLIIDYINDH
ncbi:MAG: phosphate/phosphite/phosphonate ABC transporter substrate-binding protein [Candidatus Thiodiazotropha sp.]